MKTGAASNRASAFSVEMACNRYLDRTLTRKEQALVNKLRKHARDIGQLTGGRVDVRATNRTNPNGFSVSYDPNGPTYTQSRSVNRYWMEERLMKPKKPVDHLAKALKKGFSEP